MTLMYILRIAADTAFYGAFAGLIAAKCGGGGALAGILIQCLCFGLASFGGKRRVLRLLLLLPMAAGWFLHGGALADHILLIPTAVYILWLVWTGRMEPEQGLQQNLFQVFWKVYLGFAAFAVLLGCGPELVTVSLPYAVITLVCSVLLMRALRHDPKVYCAPRYQLANTGAVLLTMGAAWLLSSKLVLQSAAAGLKAIYTYVFQPVLTFLLQILMYLLWGIGQVLSGLFTLKPGENKQEAPEISMDSAADLFGEDITAVEPNAVFDIVAAVLIIAAAVVVLVLFFRWLSRRGNGAGMVIVTENGRTTAAAEPAGRKRQESSPVRAIRGRYRRLLKHYAERGIVLERGATSSDVRNRGKYLNVSESVSEEIRSLYIQARYDGKASREEVQSMKRLCSEAEKQSQ